MVTSILSGKLVGLFRVLVNHLLFSHYRLYTLRVIQSTSSLCYRIGGYTVKRMLISEPHQTPLTPLPSQKLLYAKHAYFCLKVFKDRMMIYFMVGSHGIISVQSSFNP